MLVFLISHWKILENGMKRTSCNVPKGDLVVRMLGKWPWWPVTHKVYALSPRVAATMGSARQGTTSVSTSGEQVGCIFLPDGHMQFPFHGSPLPVCDRDTQLRSDVKEKFRKG